MSDKPIDRDGVGKTLIRKLGEKTDTEGFRTTSIDTVEGRVTMRTKGGMPEVTREGKQAKGCKLLPLKEIDADIPQGNTQNARLYYHDHEKDAEIPERRVFSSDGIFSVPVAPLKKILFRSKGLGSRVEVWLNDHTVPASHDDPMNAGTIEQVVPQEDPNKPAKGPVVLVEQARRDDNPGTQGVAYANDELAFKDDPDGKLHRRFYPPTFLFQPNPKENGDWGSLFGMAMVFARIKSITFNVQGIPGVRRVKAWFARHIPSIKRSQKPNGAVGEGYERDMHSRVFWKIGQAWPPPGYAQNVQTIKMNGGNVDLAPPYGVLSPLPKGYIHLLDPAEKCEVQPAGGSANYTSFARLSSVSHLLTFGQPWHGVLNPENGELRTEGGDLVTTFDPGDVDKDADFSETCWYINFGKKDLTLPESTTYPSDEMREKARVLGDAVMYNGRYSYGPGNEKKLRRRNLYQSLDVGTEFLVRNDDGTVHKMHVNVWYPFVWFTYCGRFDDALINDGSYTAPSPVQVAELQAPRVLGIGHSYWGHGYYSNNLIKVSPDGRHIYALNSQFSISGDAGPSMSVSMTATGMFDPRKIALSMNPDSGFDVPMAESGGSGTYVWQGEAWKQSQYSFTATSSVVRKATWNRPPPTGEFLIEHWFDYTQVTTVSGNWQIDYVTSFVKVELFDVLWVDGAFVPVEGAICSYRKTVRSAHISGGGTNSSHYDYVTSTESLNSTGDATGYDATTATYGGRMRIFFDGGVVLSSTLQEVSAETSRITYSFVGYGISSYGFMPSKQENVDDTIQLLPQNISSSDHKWMADAFNRNVIYHISSNNSYQETPLQAPKPRIHSGYQGPSGFSTDYFLAGGFSDEFVGVDLRYARFSPFQLKLSTGPTIVVGGFPITPGTGQTVHYDPRTGMPGLNNFGGVIVI